MTLRTVARLSSTGASDVERVVERCGEGNPSAASAVSAITRVIGAANAHSGRGRTYGKEKAYGSIP